MMDVKSLARLYHLLTFTTMAVGIEPDLLSDGGWDVYHHIVDRKPLLSPFLYKYKIANYTTSGNGEYSHLLP